MVRALGEVLGPDERVLVIDDARRTARASSPTSSRASRAGSTCCTGRARRARPRVPRRLPLRARRRRRAVLEMDCDFSHDPARRPAPDRGRGGRRPRARLALRRGRRDGNWGLVRRFDLARRVALRAGAPGPAASATSPAASSASAARARGAALDAIDSKGYAFQIETTYRAIRAGFRVVEMPIMFIDRGPGSKMSRRSCSRRCGRCPCCGWRVRVACNLGPDRARRHRRQLRGGRAEGRASRSWWTSVLALPRAARARPCTRSSSSSCRDPRGRGPSR